MKNQFTSHQKPNATRSAKLWLAGSIAVLLAAHQASALLTYDLRAVSVTTAAGLPGLGHVDGPKSVQVAAGEYVNFDLWAVVTGADSNPVNDGYQNSLFSIISLNNVGFTGALSGSDAAPGATPTGAEILMSGPNQRGVPNIHIGPASASVNDGITDVGNQTNVSANLIKARGAVWQAAFAGETFSGVQFTGQNATGSVIGTGQEFRIGKIQLRVTLAGTSVSINFKNPTANVIPSTGTWYTDNDGLTSGSGAQTGIANIVIAPGISVVTVPEPSAFGMVLLGAMGLVGFRRLGLRRS